MPTQVRSIQALLAAFLIGLWIWVALGYSLMPGGSGTRLIQNRGMRVEGPTGGLTRSMRHYLRFDYLRMDEESWAQRRHQHPSAPWLKTLLILQILWRLSLILAPYPRRWWVMDTIASLVIFALVLWIPIIVTGHWQLSPPLQS